MQTEIDCQADLQSHWQQVPPAHRQPPFKVGTDRADGSGRQTPAGHSKTSTMSVLGWGPEMHTLYMTWHRSGGFSRGHRQPVERCCSRHVAGLCKQPHMQHRAADIIRWPHRQGGEDSWRDAGRAPARQLGPSFDSPWRKAHAATIVPHRRIDKWRTCRSTGAAQAVCAKSVSLVLGFGACWK